MSRSPKSFFIIQLDGSQQIIKGFTNLGEVELLLSYFSDMLLTKILKTEFHTFCYLQRPVFLASAIFPEL